MNNIIFQICLLCVFLCGLLCVTHSRRSGGNVISKKKKWDYLTFTQTWPPTSCLSWQVLDPSHKCNVTTKITTWTVHGIWPSSSESDDPAFCNKSLPFNTTEIQAIKPELNKYWANVYAHTPEDQLWEHEWNKHGTCASSLPTLDTELRFFTQGLNWAKQYNMLDILQKAGITPSSQNPVLAYDIENAVHNILNVRPLLVCDYIKTNKTQYIYEIEICFDKTLQLMNCPSDDVDLDPRVLGAERCPRNALIWYPPIFHEHSQQSNLNAEESKKEESKLLLWLSYIKTAIHLL